MNKETKTYIITNIGCDDETEGEFDFTEDALKYSIKTAPAADVVPRAEVEELIRENESLAKTVIEGSELIRKLKRKVDKPKAEIAREIFEELEGYIYQHRYDSPYSTERHIDYDGFIELKKKYIGEQNDDA